MSESKEPVLCYVEECWAYFTTQDLSEQWGDDWDDAPYEHNAGTPYQYHEHDKKAGKGPWVIVKVAWDGDFEEPREHHFNSPWSVEQINSGAIAWLHTPSWVDENIAIPAGTTLSEFKILVREAGGTVYVEDTDV